MLRVIAYDIASAKRLRRVAELCLDYGVRVQKSVFECWLDEERFEELWRKLAELVRANEDRIVAYTLDSLSARQRRTAGVKMESTEQRSFYLY